MWWPPCSTNLNKTDRWEMGRYVTLPCKKSLRLLNRPTSGDLHVAFTDSHAVCGAT